MKIMRFGEKLQRLIEERQTTQAEVARSIGTYPSRVSEWANETGKPNLKQALRLARVLGVTLDYLADEEREDVPAKPELSERERQVWELVRLIGPEQAWLRLVGVAHPGPGPKLLPPPSPKINREETG